MDRYDNNENNTDNVNEGYLKEMEANNFLFNEKIKKLNNLLINANDTYEDIIHNKKIHKQNFENHHIKISELKNSDSENDFFNKENKQFAEEIMKNNYNEKDYEIGFNKNKNLFKDKDLNSEFNRENYKDKKNQNKSFDNNNYSKRKIDDDFKKENNNDNNIPNDKLFDYEKEIKKLKNENEYNHYVIEDLKNQLSKNNKKDEQIDFNMVTKEDYNNLLKEMESKDNIIDKMNEDIKNLKFKFDNLLIENKKLKMENDNLKNQKEELKAESSANKSEKDNILEKLNKLELMNKKLNKEFLNLSNDYKKAKEEKEKLKSIIDEQNAAIFNYEKQLSSKPKIQKFEKFDDYNENKMNIETKLEKNYELNNYNDENFKYDYSDEKRNKYKNNSYRENENYNNIEGNNYYTNYKKVNDNKENEYEYVPPFTNSERNKNKLHLDERKTGDLNFNRWDYNLDNEKNKPYKYHMKKSNSKSFDIISEKNSKLKKGELNYLENYLNSLLKERSKLEKMFNEIPTHPRTLKDIKLRNTIKDKIDHNENEIMITQQQLKNIRES